MDCGGAIAIALWNVCIGPAAFGEGIPAGGTGTFEGPAVEGPAVVSFVELSGGGESELSLSSRVARLRFLAVCCCCWSFLPRLVNGRLASPISCECSDISNDVVSRNTRR